MRILAIADTEDEVLLSRLSHTTSGYYNVVISCGDLSPSYLSCVATLANAPLFYVRGNHDSDYECATDLGGINLDGHIVQHNNLRFAGLEGSYCYRSGIVGYNEQEMRHKVWRLSLKAKLKGGIDVLVTHAPARGFGDLADLPHRGFNALNTLLLWTKPQLMLHGHVHLSYGNLAREQAHPSGTRIINAYGWQEIEL